jgi:hypothetical protein
LAQRHLEITEAFPGSDDSCDNAMAESMNVMLKPSCTATTAVLTAEECQWFLESLNREPGLSGLRRGRMVYSGDVSEIDDDGSVTVIGHLKEDVVTRQCEANSSPEIEESCCSARRRRLDMPPRWPTREQSVCR